MYSKAKAMSEKALFEVEGGGLVFGEVVDFCDRYGVL